MSVPGRIAVAAGLAGVAGALALSAAGHGAERAAAVGGGTVVIVPPSREAAAAVPFSGGTAGQRHLVRDVLARVGAPRQVRGVRFEGATVRIAVPSAATDGPAWRTDVLAREVMFRAVRSGTGIDRVLLDWGSGAETVDAAAAPGRATTPARVLAIVRRRAAAGGTALRSVRLLPVRTGAVEVTARATVRRILGDDDGGIARALSPAGNDVAWTIRLVAPNGVELYRVGHVSGYGFVRPAGLGRAASPPLPADLAGPTRLSVEFTWAPRAGRTPPPVSVTLDCEGASPGVADPARACRRLTATWLRLLPPRAGICPGPLTDAVHIGGTFHGVRVERWSGPCGGVSLTRWAALLGVTPPARR
ncbi:MAG: hypothetical protein U0237_17730 [Thermoleophilia bacterium]